MASPLRPPSARQAAAEFLYASSGLALGLFWSILIGVGLIVGVATAIVTFAVPLAVALALGRLGAEAERHRAALVFGAPIARPARPPTPEGWPARIWAWLKDRAMWRGIGYLLLLGPVGVLSGALALGLWGGAVALVAAPAAQSFAPDGSLLGDLGLAPTLAGPIVAILLAFVAVLATRALAGGGAALAASLLGPDERAELAERVSTLETTRAGAVESSDAQLRRIERDLHDGAQHRLSYIAMELARAREKIHESPEAADALLAGAHEESKRAMSELRDLVRGIHPSVLTDRGLDAAISGITERCPVPVDVTVDLPRRPAAAQETAAYYVVAESLTNVARHSRAERAGVSVALSDGRLVVTVTDDGRGGAAGGPGSGLDGLRQRLEALDGTLTVDSPDGGPTTIRAELPCAS